MNVLRKVVQIPILFLAAKEAGHDVLTEERVYHLFPLLRSRGFFCLGGYMYSHYFGLYSSELQSDIDELIATHTLARKSAGSEIYSLTKYGENYAKKLISDVDTRSKILGTKSFDQLKKDLSELLMMPPDKLEKETYEVLRAADFFL